MIALVFWLKVVISILGAIGIVAVYITIAICLIGFDEDEYL